MGRKDSNLRITAYQTVAVTTWLLPKKPYQSNFSEGKELGWEEGFLFTLTEEERYISL